MILTNVVVATMRSGYAFGLIGAHTAGQAHSPSRGAIVLSGPSIEWVGMENELPAAYRSQDAIDLEGRLVTPGLIDCHTHIVHGGNRAMEFEQRLSGATYTEIAQRGGGILSTVASTRKASEDALLESALQRVDQLISEGVCALEIKSGYGLDIESELKMLRVARTIAAKRPIHVRTSYLAAHTIPAEYQGRPDEYIDEVCLPGMDLAHREGLIDAVDGFCEGIAFSVQQIDKLFMKAKSLGIQVKLHAEQLSHQGGAKLAAQWNALSADHLEYATGEDAYIMGRNGTVAVMLPGAFYTLRQTQSPPISAFRAHGVPMAVATDCNPGSSPLCSILIAMNMACTLFRMTPEESLAGTTKHAAQALGLENMGLIAPGMRADLAVWNATHPSELSYRIGFNTLWKRVFGGVL